MKNKKAVLDNLIIKLLWIVFFILILGGVYFLIKSLTG